MNSDKEEQETATQRGLLDVPALIDAGATKNAAEPSCEPQRPAKEWFLGSCGTIDWCQVCGSKDVRRYVQVTDEYGNLQHGIAFLCENCFRPYLHNLIEYGVAP